MAAGKVVKECVGCGTPFESYAYKNRLYCSMKCWRRHQLGQSQCQHCGKTFTHKASKAKMYCSPECRHAAGWKASDPSKTVTTDCPVCGKSFTYYKSWPKKTCSWACYQEQVGADKKTTTTCPECGKEFEYYLSWPRKYCSRTCASKATVSNIVHFVPTAYSTTCEQCGKEYTTTPSLTRGRFCSLWCYGDWLAEHGPRGEDHPAWRGGGARYYGRNWNQQRRAARRRDRYTCQRCGITEAELGHALDVHHIRRFKDFDDYREANKVSNLVSLCTKCHMWVEYHEPGT